MSDERWAGGHIHIQKDGRRLYVIERRRGGRKFHISTRCTSEWEAIEHWRRFQADPWKYEQEMREGRPLEQTAVFLTDELAARFTLWHRQVKGVSRKHAKETGRLLDKWIEDLRGVDLRKATLRHHLKPALDRRETMRAARIAAIKVFYSWLREVAVEHGVVTAEDPTLDLPVPQSKPEKRKRKKAVEMQRLEAVFPLLGPVHRDVLLVCAHTGMHFTELERFVRGEDDAELSYARRGTTIATMILRHKNKDIVQIVITDEDALRAAERLKARGYIPREMPPDVGPEDFVVTRGKQAGQKKAPRPNQSIAWACDKAGVPRFRMGQMRHTFATMMREAGATRQEIAALLHHKDERTTDTYVDIEVPTTPVEPPKLRLVR